jgi:hypothetical protein
MTPTSLAGLVAAVLAAAVWLRLWWAKRQTAKATAERDAARAERDAAASERFGRRKRIRLVRRRRNAVLPLDLLDKTVVSIA